jgi:PPM family protein phosphatase
MSIGYRIVASTGLDRGDREYQQDQLCLLAHPRAQGCLMGVVADGMGGRSGGRKASDQVMLTAKQLFERYHADTDSPSDFLTQVAHESHVVIKLTAVAAEQEPHSTIAAFVLNPKGDCHWVHSGDSRIYHFRQGQLVYRTKDHSFVQTLVDRGELTEAQAQNDRRSNLLLHCLGTEPDPQLALHHIERIGPGDSLLACSDGLWHYFSVEELASTIHSLPPREACELLLTQAKQRACGTGDNISLIVVKFEPLAVASEAQAKARVNPFAAYVQP